MRSAGAYFTNALETMSSAFEGNWTTGVVGGNKQDETSLGKNGKGRVISMFALSSALSGGFAVRYGSDLLLAFHLAEAFDSNDSSRSLVILIVQIANV